MQNFTDTGSLCHLTGLRDPDHAAFGPLAGPLMETDLGDRCGPGFLIHAGRGRLPLGSGVTAAGFADL